MQLLCLCSGSHVQCYSAAATTCSSMHRCCSLGWKTRLWAGRPQLCPTEFAWYTTPVLYCFSAPATWGNELLRIWSRPKYKAISARQLLRHPNYKARPRFLQLLRGLLAVHLAGVSPAWGTLGLQAAVGPEVGWAALPRSQCFQ